MTEADYATFEEIRSLMGPVKKQGDFYLGFCPVHGDGQKHGGKGGQSLILSTKGVLECKAGCSFKDVMTALRERAGVTRANGNARPPSPPRPPKTGDGAGYMLIEAYEYRDPQSGELVGVKGRFERPNPEAKKGYDKQFKWRLPSSTVWDGLKGAKVESMPLWGAPEIAALPPETRIWFAEGESATKAIRKAGESATCGSWGASQREYGDAFEVLRGRHVILWPDNDGPGREYMAEVRRKLRGVAKTVTVVSAPVPPGGDAVEFFQAGGKVEDLLANKIIEPTVDVLGPDHFIVRMPTDDGGQASFEFADMHYKRETLEANLCVRYSGDPESYEQFINLKSQSTREGLARALGSMFGKDAGNWTGLVAIAYSRVRKAYDDVPKAQLVGKLAKEPDNRFLVDTLVPLGSSTLLFGLGGTGKSTLAKRLMLEIAMGGEFLGQRVYQPGAVVIVDWEDPRSARTEFERVLEGMGFPAELLEELPVYFWSPEGAPLAGHAAALRRFCEQNEVVAGLIDSAMPACGGEPEKSEPALQFFNALNSIPITWIVLSHVSKGEADLGGMKRPYGNVVWENMPRRVWALHTPTEGRETSLTRDIVLRCTKTNRRWPPPFSYRVLYTDDDTGPIRFVKTDLSSIVAEGATELRGHLPLRDQLRRILEEEGALDIPHILERMPTGTRADSVRSTLARHPEFEGQQTGTGRGATTIWSLRPPATCAKCSLPVVGLNDTGQEVCGEHL